MAAAKASVGAFIFTAKAAANAVRKLHLGLKQIPHFMRQIAVGGPEVACSSNSVCMSCSATSRDRAACQHRLLMGCWRQMFCDCQCVLAVIAGSWCAD